jgi:hypothetical protein
MDARPGISLQSFFGHSDYFVTLNFWMTGVVGPSHANPIANRDSLNARSVL